MCGDWNLVINRDIETEKYWHVNNPKLDMKF